MQIDFHHAVTYVVARLAGFEHEKANTVAHAAQYVDDATNVDLIRFDNRALFSRTASAHKMIDTRNIRGLANHSTWLPFHFLPGNGGLPAGQNPDGSFIEKIICTPNSHIAQDMVSDAIADKNKPYGLHRLGVAMHVYADTWAHQGFVGEINSINDVDDASAKNTTIFGSIMSKIKDNVDNAIPPLGHGRAWTYPDMPYLDWHYKNRNGVKIERNNTRDFCEAAQHMCLAMQRFREVEESGISEQDMAAIKSFFLSFKDDEGEKRHEKWLEILRNGSIPSIDPIEVSYPIGEDAGSWKKEALGSSFDLEVHPYAYSS
ncbi:MAG: hypothetical protein HQL70_10680 [Magnetococcales bacterium]|nr:hypothetical protein [Magnetococcales bacterium]